MNLQDIRINLNELIVYVLIANIILGFLFGTFPLISGLKLKNRKYAVYGFIGSIIGGAISGVILSYPIAFIFTWLIIRDSRETVEAISKNSTEHITETTENR